MNISLPEALRRWVDQEVQHRGYGTASEFVRDMIRRERQKSIAAQLDQELLRAVQTPVSEMKESDWNDIKKSATRRRKNA